MRIYTKTGDDGTTGLFGGLRLQKDDARVEAYGTVDELNAVLGVARSLTSEPSLGERLEHIQRDLFVLGAELATAPGREAKLTLPRLGAADALRLEQEIDEATTTLAPLKNFVLPGAAARAALHHARTVCRRAERRLITARRESPIGEALLIYLNRLSDWLFTYARAANQAAGVADVPWAPRGLSGE